MKLVVQLHADDGEVLQGEGVDVAEAIRNLSTIVLARGVSEETHIMAQGLMIMQLVGREMDELYDVSGATPKMKRPE